MHRAVVSLPDGLDQKVRWLLGELCSAAGVRVADGAPALPLDPSWDLAAAAALLARDEELDAPVDEHGRFPASASALAPGAAPLDDLVRALRETGGLDAGGGHVAARQRSFEARGGAHHPAPAPAPRGVDVVRQRDREARAAGILRSRRPGGLAQREHEVVERRRTRRQRRGRGREAPVLVDRRVELLVAREQGRGGREIP